MPPRQALNLASAVPDLQALQPSDFPPGLRDYTTSAEIDLMPWLLLAALLLALADTLIGLQLRGLLIRRRAAAAAAAAFGGLLLVSVAGRARLRLRTKRSSPPRRRPGWPTC